MRSVQAREETSPRAEGEARVGSVMSALAKQRIARQAVVAVVGLLTAQHEEEEDDAEVVSELDVDDAESREPPRRSFQGTPLAAQLPNVLVTIIAEAEKG
jgi:hypothetical protein